MPMSEQTFRAAVLARPDGQWELHRGRLREKPDMTAAHNRLMMLLGHQLLDQLNWSEFEVRINAGRVSRTDETYYIPDLLVLPAELVRPLLDHADVLEVYGDPIPLVVEIWSPSTRDYDVDDKLPEYQRRGDAEIWRLHPFERTLTAWRRQPDGMYDETVYRGSTVQPIALPNVVIDLDKLFSS